MCGHNGPSSRRHKFFDYSRTKWRVRIPHETGICIEIALYEFSFLNSNWQISVEEILPNVELKWSGVGVGWGGGVASTKPARTKPRFKFVDSGIHPIL